MYHEDDVHVFRNYDVCNYNNYFTSVFNQAHKLQVGQSHSIPDSYFVLNSLFLAPVTYNEIVSTLANMSNSSSIGTDGLSPLIIKSNSSLIGHQLTFIFNLSFTQGVFPKLLKSSIVIPIFKAGSHSEPGNYRHISILTIFSKLLEKLYYNRLTSNPINYHGFLHNDQFGFRKHKSTSLAVTNVLSSLITKIKTNKKVAFVLLDLKKAFDFNNHDWLLMKVKHYGIRGLPIMVIQLFK
jgi:hypothetical protein